MKTFSQLLTALCLGLSFNTMAQQSQLYGYLPNQDPLAINLTTTKDTFVIKAAIPDGSLQPNDTYNRRAQLTLHNVPKGKIVFNPQRSTSIGKLNCDERQKNIALSVSRPATSYDELPVAAPNPKVVKTKQITYFFPIKTTSSETSEVTECMKLYDLIVLADENAPVEIEVAHVIVNTGTPAKPVYEAKSIATINKKW